jgi:type II secretory pathway component PulM
MSAALVEFLSSRPPRERWLIGLLVLVILPLAVVFGLLLPLREAHADALRAQKDAVAVQNWVVQRVGEKLELGRAPDTQPSAPIGSSGIEQSLIEAGLRTDVSDLSVRDSGVIELRFDLVTFTTLANWLSASKPNWGYTISSFRIEATDVSGKVSASLALSPQT